LRYEFLIGLRYLRARRRARFVSLIAIISLAGIAIGTFTSSVALCLMSGVEIDLRGRLLAFTPQVTTEIAKPMLEVAGGPVPPEPEKSPEEQWHQEEQERVDAVIKKHFHSQPSKNPQHELDRWYYGSHYLGHVLGVNSEAIVTPGMTLHQSGFQGDDIGVEVDDTDGAVDEVERELPPTIDGIRVEVFPAPTGVVEDE
jgi:hypothetical protein